MSPSERTMRKLVRTAFESGRASYGLLALFIIGLPVFIPLTAANEILVFAIFAVGYNLILGYGGQLSFGHAAFFGGGAYAVIIVFNLFGESLLVSIIASLLFVIVMSFVYGWISLLRRDLAFALITLGLAQITFFVIFQWEPVTGGSDGLGFPIGEKTILGIVDPTVGGVAFYAFASLCLILSWILVRRLVLSPFGRTIVAIRENEGRAKALGYDTDRILLITFVISGLISGLAGILYAILYQYLTPSLAGWQLSGEVVLITLLGGLGTLAGPIFGGTIFVYLEEILISTVENWEIPFGAIIIIVVVFAPEGVYGKIRETIHTDEGAPVFERIQSRIFD